MSTPAPMLHRDQWLRCEGRLPAKIASWMHYAWPFARGQWRLTDLLRRTGWKSFTAVPFRSACGVRVVLDIASNDFLYLSGRIPVEPTELSFVADIVREGDMFVDAGAHRGLYILHVLGRLGRDGLYFAIEPSPSNFAFLESAYGNADGRLRRLMVALSDADGEARLEDDGALTAHLCASVQTGTKVATARLDTLLRDEALEGKQVVVKLDTEGHEARAICGCGALAKRGVHPIFLVEFLPVIFGQTREDILRAFEETFPRIYRYFGIHRAANRLEEFPSNGAPSGNVNNILAIPETAMERLRDFAT